MPFDENVAQIVYQPVNLGACLFDNIQTKPRRIKPRHKYP